MQGVFEAKENFSMNEPRDPAWFQNPTKRVIPNHLVPKKKTGFLLINNAKKDSENQPQSSSTAEGSSPTDFSLISFGGSSNRKSSTLSINAPSLFTNSSKADTEKTLTNQDFPLYNENADLPPARSLYDLNDDVIISLERPAKQTESSLNKDPKSFANAFSTRSFPAASSEEASKKTFQNSLLNHESAVLVFGYPEHMANQVIAYFLELGTILEDFEVLRSAKNSNKNTLATLAVAGGFPSDDSLVTGSQSSPSAPPIFSGASWVKLTYDNPSSAADAIQQSGSVFNGVLIGVVPYTKDAIEKLQKRKLSVSEDIGGGVSAFTPQQTQKIDKAVVGDSNDIQASYIKRLDLRDGAELFLKSKTDKKQDATKNEKGSNEKLGFFGLIANYFFGFHDL